MDIFLFDSHQKTKRKFSPEKSNVVRMYVCGPTVYDDAHLGHARSALSFDLLFRLLLHLKYDVKYVQNITDIDDKIIARMQKEQKSLEELTSFYAKRYRDDMAKLGVLPPSQNPLATKHVEKMADIAKDLLEKNMAYKNENGDVYMDVSKDLEYGNLSLKTQDDGLSRIDNASKKDGRDFVLWKQTNTEPHFKTSLGFGRPSWHIECLAMIDESFEQGEFLCDIHGGGADLFFPHHENENSICALKFSKKLAKYWLHNGFVKIGGEKMSKSLGNSFYLHDILDIHAPEVVRFYLISVSYRNDFSFSLEDLENTKVRLSKIYRLKKQIFGAKPKVREDFKNELLSCLCDDLNTSKALALIDKMINDGNSKLTQTPNDKSLKQGLMGNIDLISELLGVGGGDPYAFFQYGINEMLQNEINNLIDERAIAKANKDFIQADKIRDKLHSMGVTIMDTNSTTVWEIN